MCGWKTGKMLKKYFYASLCKKTEFMNKNNEMEAKCKMRDVTSQGSIIYSPTAVEKNPHTQVKVVV